MFDWTVPREWNIRDAWIKNLKGDRVVDFRQLQSARRELQRAGSKEGVAVGTEAAPAHACRSIPTWIPYKTSYYSESWGFCVSAEQAAALTDPEYDVCIDSTLEDGHLTYGECYLPGESADEVLLSCHVCHPSLCNDNLSGISVAVLLAGGCRRLAAVGCRTGFCSFRARSARSPGWRGTRTGWARFGTGWC